MDLYNLEFEINVIVNDLKTARMNRDRDPEDAWNRIHHALDVAKELARELEAGATVATVDVSLRLAQELESQVSEIWNL